MLKNLIENAKSISIFSDGACSGNPGPGGWGAIIYIDNKEVIELGSGDSRTTNNKMEMTALIEALKFIGPKNLSSLGLTIFTDSKYLIHGMTQWIFQWKRNTWMTKAGEPVANQELWKVLDELIQHVNGKIHWQYVPGHSGFPGNERCDEIAVGFSKDTYVDLYIGPREEYSVDLDFDPEQLKVTMATKSDEKKKSSNKGKKAYSYLSLVNGVVQRHQTWDSCQARVNGVPNAKFKKSLSAEDENQILKSWGK
ncbi:MAG TPA: ribonuclease HI [Pseudobdellovibrionaceae bacterium]|nr:ribonuclease HI [Pseudobdellovibrionaceae bacterium]